ncbi:MAG: hypothetical protein QNK70_02095 [Crocinitomicaceae bacterium]
MEQPPSIKEESNISPVKTEIQAKPRIVNKPEARLSIKQELQKEKDANNKIDKDLPQEKYTIDRLIRIWRQYAFQVKDDGMETFYNALVKRDPLIEKNDVLKLFVDNKIQVDYIKPLLNELISFIRNSLKNHNISVVIELTETTIEDVKFLNGKDKFEVMVKKNPDLNTLKNLFNLDVEF